MIGALIGLLFPATGGGVLPADFVAAERMHATGAEDRQAGIMQEIRAMTVVYQDRTYTIESESRALIVASERTT